MWKGNQYQPLVYTYVSRYIHMHMQAQVQTPTQVIVQYMCIYSIYASQKTG